MLNIFPVILQSILIQINKIIIDITHQVCTYVLTGHPVYQSIKAFSRVIKVYSSDQCSSPLMWDTQLWCFCYNAWDATTMTIYIIFAAWAWHKKRGIGCNPGSQSPTAFDRFRAGNAFCGKASEPYRAVNLNFRLLPILSYCFALYLLYY